MTTNKRDLKRQINYVCSDLFAECVATSLSGKPDKDDVNALLASILVIHNDYIKRVSHLEPGLQPKKYYKDLIDSFYQQVDEIVDHIGNLG
ncbi:MAG: hypothetical protein J6I61_12300 [Prevotella sp.]|nr:hypothetical protein [Prevotella sp.]